MKAMGNQFLSVLLVITMLCGSFMGGSVYAAEPESNTVYDQNGLKVDFKVDIQWDGFFNGTIAVTNTGTQPVENWAITFDFPHEISNIWNAAIIEHQPGVYTVKNLMWNQDIPVGSSINFGFTAAATGDITRPTFFVVNTKPKEVASERIIVEYVPYSDWGSGYSSALKITNLSNTTIEDWTIDFDFARSIENLSSGNLLNHEGTHYTIQNDGYTQNLSNGQAILLGLGGTGGVASDVPTSFVVKQMSLSFDLTSDTDGDQVLDWVEVCVNGTDPLVPDGLTPSPTPTITPTVSPTPIPDEDIDCDALPDAYEEVILRQLFLNGVACNGIESVLPSDDYDGDLLTLEQEYEYDTNPFSVDTDEDGLGDNVEVTEYNTNPINWDTDNDDMGDATEITSGLNPLLSDTDGDGITDSQEVVTQDVRIDTVNIIDINKTLVKPIVEITGSGDFSKKLYVEEIQNDKTILDIDCRVGTAFDFVHNEDLAFESCQLTFAVSDMVLQNNNIEDLVIAYYDDNGNVLQLLDTTYDSANKTISASVEHFSKYLVVSVPDYLYNIDAENEGSIITSGKADVVFVVDTTGSMSDAINNVRTNINQFVTELEENKVDIRLGLVEYKDLHVDGEDSTKSYNWYTDVSTFKTQLGSLGVSGGGDTPESAVDAINCAQNMSFRFGVKKYIILITDADFLEGTEEDSSVTMSDKIAELVSSDIVTSVVTHPLYYPVYSDLVTQTDGVTCNIYNNFATELKPLITKMGDQVNDGCWIRLSNGSVIRLDKDPTLGDETVDTDSDGIPDVIELKSTYQFSVYDPKISQYMSIDAWTFCSNPADEDTDGDGFGDVDDLSPCQFDTAVIESTDSLITFNTGRTWISIPCNSFDYLDNLLRAVDGHVENEIPIDEFRVIVTNAQKNSEQHFNIDELTYIGFVNNEGSKLYMDNVSNTKREIVFERLTGRESRCYKHSGILWWDCWEEVPHGTEGGFFTGTVLSEADLNFSIQIYKVCDAYTVLDLGVKLGALIIAAIVVVKATPIVLANIQAIKYFVETYGVRQGLSMYTLLGTSNLPDGVISFIQADMSDGDSCVDDVAAAMQRESVLYKLDTYLLDPEHNANGGKAKFFAETLGFTRANMEDLAKQIVFNEGTAVVFKVTEHGTQYSTIISIVGSNGYVTDVTFGWIIKADGIARLVTAYPA